MANSKSGEVERVSCIETTVKGFVALLIQFHEFGTLPSFEYVCLFGRRGFQGFAVCCIGVALIGREGEISADWLACTLFLRFTI